MSDNNVPGRLEELIEQQNQVLRELRLQLDELGIQRNELDKQSLKAASLKRDKDLWDRTASVAPIISAFIIAAIGAYFTYTYNLQQLKVQEIQTIERFIPHLMGDEKSKRAAILAISSLGNAKIAAKVASIYASEGTASALQSIAERSESKDRSIIRDALAQTLDSLADKYQYENKFDDALETYKRALAIKEETVGKDSPQLAENLDKLAKMYQLHGDHALATLTLKRAASLKGRASAEGTANNDDAGGISNISGSNYTFATGARDVGESNKNGIDGPKPAPDIAVGSHINEPDTAYEKHQTRFLINKSAGDASRPNSLSAEDSRPERFISPTEQRTQQPN